MSGLIFSDGQWRRAEAVAAEAAKQAAKDKEARDVGRVVLSVAMTFVGAWLLMLAVGSLHADVPAVPTVSYWTALLTLAGVDAGRVAVSRIRFEK
ncbi:hypothetical protein GCM10009548_01960 [Streptomyces malaysiensis subsp. malaysiensis]|uniref:Holin of 3TMs, for gene-transfer release n=1 Tax=Streptomyces malaysiensis TaxID=92644 RepID=A0ABX6W4B7_STRMQ|nr:MULTISPECIES: hypothetical protein [Streptomyces]QPI56339.1 hypothetical protein I1A49_16570 [Streptomyces solisilvae]UHH17826.1 hypothetical protein LUV23_16685 [Streptomyces sp. HNM0561]